MGHKRWWQRPGNGFADGWDRIYGNKETPQAQPVSTGPAPARTIIGYGPCKCVLPALRAHCDGKCNPVWADQPSPAGAAKGGIPTTECAQ